MRIFALALVLAASVFVACGDDDAVFNGCCPPPSSDASRPPIFAPDGGADAP